MWQGLLALKNDQAAVQMHFVFGNPHVARESLPCNSDGSTPPLRIAQRMRLEQTQVDGVARKMQVSCGIINYLICCSKVEHFICKSNMYFYLLYVIIVSLVTFFVADVHCLSV
jgi:hypothetical protein